MTQSLEILKKKSKNNDEINWVTAIFMGLFHVGAIAALFFFTWKAFFVSMFLWWVSGSLGIGMGYHRLLTHRGYKTPKWVEYFSDHLRHAGARRRTDFLGGHAPHPSSIFRSGRRSAFARATASGGRTWAGS